jgi:AAA domain, putative AbiEii toxin, Type IV TA system
MISRFQLKFGRAPGLPADPIDPTAVTVFVGPNNSGKSKVLSEIERYCRFGDQDATAVILDHLDFVALAPEAVAGVIEDLVRRPNLREAVNPGSVPIGGRTGATYTQQQVPREILVECLQHPALHPQPFCRFFLTFSTLMLGGRSRIDLVNPQAGGDLQEPPRSSLQALFRDDAKRHEVRRIVSEAFGVYFVIDPTSLGQLRVRLSQRLPLDDREEQALDQEAVQFHANAELIDTAGDGIKAFTGIVMELIAGDPRVVLIDEPEAFLHQSLAFRLGNEVSRAALGADKRVFVSTHSPMFVMGCIQSGVPVNIIRLTYRGGVATARVLPSAEILELMRNPLLRSTGVLSGLFYECVVVVESDTDRAFYQEINERLLRFRPDWGIPHCLFINAQNKQTVQTIIRPLRKLGIPAAGVVDIDILKEGGTVWTSLLESAHIPAISHPAFANLRAAVKHAMDATGGDMKRQGGIAILGANDQEAAQNLLKQLSDYGIFVVPGGELESWLKPLGSTGHGPQWLITVFEKMGTDPDGPGFARPSADDVWEFLSRIKRWLLDPTRRGIPT